MSKTVEVPIDHLELLGELADFFERIADVSIKRHGVVAVDAQLASKIVADLRGVGVLGPNAEFQTLDGYRAGSVPLEMVAGIHGEVLRLRSKVRELEASRLSSTRRTIFLSLLAIGSWAAAVVLR